ncbi:MAG: Uma2 family endonuclease [Chloroflexota bacterium]
MATQARATIDDVLRLASAGERYELVDGELIAMAPTGFGHGDLEAQIAWVLRAHVVERRLGKIVVGEVLFQLDPEGRIARAADVAFVRQERLPPKGTEHRPFVGAPDLAVEIVSPGDSAEDVERKVADWLEHGTLAVLVIYPTARRIALRRPGRDVSLRGDDEIDLDPVIAGFRCQVSDLFSVE